MVKPQRAICLRNTNTLYNSSGSPVNVTFTVHFEIRTRRFCVLRKKRYAAVKPPQFMGHVTVDPKTLQLVYTPWNVSQQEVETAVSKLDSALVKRELIVWKECEFEDNTETEERSLGTIINYEELRELYLERSP